MYGLYSAEQREFEDFMREVEILSTLRHENIVRFLGASFEPPCCFVTELAERGSLHQVIHDTANPLRQEP